MRRAFAHRLIVAGIAFHVVMWATAIALSRENVLNPYVVPNVAFFLTGAIVAWQIPGHRVAWLLFAFGPLDALGAISLAGSVRTTGAVAAWLGGLSAGTQTLVTLLIPMLLLFFPTGGLPSPRWRPVFIVGVGVLVAMTLGGLLTGGILAGVEPGVEGPLGPAGTRVGSALGVTIVMVPLLLVASVVGLFVRWRRADGVERQQLKVLLVAGAAMLIAAIAMPFTPVTGGGSTGDVIIAASLTVLPVATGIALLRYRLWDLDLVLSRSVVVVLLAILVTAVYGIVVLGIGSVISRGTDDLMLQVLATALVAVAFAPARERATRLANRLVFGRRATPFEVLAEVSDRMAGSVPDNVVLDRIAALLAAGTGASSAAVWLRTNGHLDAAAVWPADSGAVPSVAISGEELPVLPGAEIAEAVRDGSHLVGALTLRTPRGEGLTPAERRVVDDMVASVAVLLRRVRLDAELAARIEELRASRRRLVNAQDAARRHLERDLHDGAQQQLVAVKVRLGIAKSLARKEGDEALAERLDVLVGQTDEAVDELRAIAHGIYPPLLAAEGLQAAITALARRQPIPVDVAVVETGRHPEDVEAAVYFAVAQLLEQAAAAGAAVAVDLRETADQLELDVSGAPVDVAPLLDRIDAVGGSISATGDSVVVRLPIGVAV